VRFLNRIYTVNYTVFRFFCFLFYFANLTFKISSFRMPRSYYHIHDHHVLRNIQPFLHANLYTFSSCKEELHIWCSRKCRDSWHLNLGFSFIVVFLYKLVYDIMVDRPKNYCFFNPFTGNFDLPKQNCLNEHLWLFFL
jgi:hypothetical protein